MNSGYRSGLAAGDTPGNLSRALPHAEDEISDQRDWSGLALDLETSWALAALQKELGPVSSLSIPGFHTASTGATSATVTALKRACGVKTFCDDRTANCFVAQKLKLVGRGCEEAAYCMARMKAGLS